MKKKRRSGVLKIETSWLKLWLSLNSFLEKVEKKAPSEEPEETEVEVSEEEIRQTAERLHMGPDQVRAYHSLMCPHCGNIDLSLGAKYYRICGKSAINICEGHKRGRFAGQRHYIRTMRFCLACGAKKVFQTHNFTGGY